VQAIDASLTRHPDVLIPHGIEERHGGAGDIRQFNDFDVRLDYNMTGKDLAFARYSYGQDVFQLTPRLGTLSSGFGSGTNLSHPRGVAAGETHTFGNTIVNDFRFGYSRNNQDGPALSTVQLFDSRGDECGQQVLDCANDRSVGHAQATA